MLWQRRAAATDFLTLHAGVGNVPWKPPVDPASVKRSGDDVAEVVADAVLPAAPVEVELTHAGVVGIVGDRADALAVARSLLCQAATHCGPADLTIGVFCDPGREDEWTWTGWLPHVRRLGDGSGGQWLSTERSRSESMLRAMRDGIETFPTPAVLLVLDSDVLTEGRDAPARWLLGHGRPMRSALVQQRARDPGLRHRHRGDRGAAAGRLHDRDRRRAATPTGTRHPPARPDHDRRRRAGRRRPGGGPRCAADLARFDDPELSIPGASLPALVRLPPLLGIDEVNAAAIRRSWASSTRISTPLGVGENGVFGIDLVRDGPHGLVGGTTGSGKSEFLRSMVAGLAARNDPTRLTFILIDFKGGAAFKTCERLPHTIGTVSNLDEQLADRALTALEAELRYRQGMFAAAGEGVDNLDAYLATKPERADAAAAAGRRRVRDAGQGLPRRAVKSLVSVAAVGRTLGVHMILATQRPAGVVNEDILANTNLRVALRVQSRDDSTNVIGVPAAAAIGRTQWGRAYVKLGQDDITPVQTALVTGRAEAQTSQLVDAAPRALRADEQRETGTTERDDDATDLDLLIDAIVEANDELGYAPPRPVWPEPLGDAGGADRRRRAARARAPAVGRGPRVAGRVRGRRRPATASADPGRLGPRPRQPAAARHPRQRHETTLSTIALTLADAYAPEDLDLLVLDLGTRDLAPLADLPHTAAYVGSGSGDARAAGAVPQVHPRRARAAPCDPGPAPPDGRADRRPRRAEGRVRRLRGPQAARRPLPRVLRRTRRADVDGDHDVAVQGRADARSRRSPPRSGCSASPTRTTTASSGVPTKLAPPPMPGRCVLAETKLQAHVATADGTLPEAVARSASGGASRAQGAGGRPAARPRSPSPSSRPGPARRRAVAAARSASASPTSGSPSSRSSRAST